MTTKTELLGTRFYVDAVDPCTDLLPATSHKDLLALLEEPVEAASGFWLQVVRLDQANQFMAGLEAAYTKHYPLILSPDVIWTVLVQGLAHHISLHSESLRPMFVNHAGQAEMLVLMTDFVKGSPENDWETVFAKFAQQIGENVKEDVRAWVEPDFSTTGRVELACAHAALMAVMKPYFSYLAGYGCGFPWIHLTGTAEDWEKLREKVGRWTLPGDADLSWWTSSLKPILDGFVNAAKGMADVEWWRNMIKVSHPYMSTAITGWINWLFPYVRSYTNRVVLDETSRFGELKNFVGRARCDALNFKRNPTLGIIGKPVEGFGDWPEGNISIGVYPPSFLSTPIGVYPPSFLSTPLTVKNYQTGKEFPMEVLSGITSVRQDQESKALIPQCGWAVRDAAAPA